MTEKQGNIVSYTLDEIRALQSQDTGTDWARIDAMSQEEANANAVADDGAYLQDAEFFQPIEFSGGRRRIIGIELDEDVERFYTKLGKDSQPTINAALRAYMHQQQDQRI